MTRSMMAGAVLGAIAVVGGGAVAGYRYMTPPEPQYAEVLAVVPVTEKVEVPGRECHESSTANLTAATPSPIHPGSTARQQQR